MESKTLASLLPPRGIFIPNDMIYNSELQPEVLVTWMQLRGLAWKGWVTPPLRMQEISQLTGTGRRALSMHIRVLKAANTLDWSSNKRGELIFVFPMQSYSEERQQSAGCINPVLRYMHSNYPGSQAAESYFPEQIMGYLKF